MESDSKMDLALWRYGIISPLLHRDANDAHLCELLTVMAQKKYVKPDGGHVSISPETMRKWLYSYNRGGLEALSNKTRSDKGLRNVPQALADAMFELRRKNPKWTLALILKELADIKVWDETSPSRSALYRFANDNNLMRDPLLNETDIIRPFEFEKFGQMWMADFMYGPKLWEGSKKRQSYLHVIIDDCTRYVVSGGFYKAESTESLVRELMTASRRFGLPHRFYSDNGSAYNSKHLKIICARLRIAQPHTPPRRPRGRGKCERFFRTLKEQFLAGYRFKTFDEINSKLPQYLEAYHHRKHSSLKCTPMQKRLGVETVCRQIPEVADIEALFRMKRRCRVYNNGTIRIHTKVFEVPGCAPNSRVNVYYMPWDSSQVYYGDDMRPAKEVNLSANAHRFEHPNFSK